MPESDPLPPGWAPYLTGALREAPEAWRLRVLRQAPHEWHVLVDLVTPFGTLPHHAYAGPTLPDACRRAEEPAEELSQWRPPKLEKDVNERE